MANEPVKDRSFLHSGKLGDIVYALPAIRALGGGTLFLRPDEKIGLSQSALEAIWPLLERLDYVRLVQTWDGRQVNYNLDKFRTVTSPFLSVVQSFFTAFELPESAAHEAWLPKDLPRSEPGYDVLFARSLNRYSQPGFWEAAYRIYGQRAAFVGSHEEHQAFEARHGPIPHRKAKNLLELAGLIASCRLFIGNQSCPFAIAEGLKQNAVLEVDPECPNCLFQRHNLLNVQSGQDLWMIEAAEDLLGLGGSLTSTWWMTTNLELDDRLRGESRNAQNLERLMLQIRARRPVSLTVRNPYHWSQVFDAFTDIHREESPGEGLVLTGDPQTVQTILREQLYRITGSEGVANDLPELTQSVTSAFARAGAPEDAAGETLRLVEVRFEAESIEAAVDVRTAGVLGPATSPGTSVIVVSFNSQGTIGDCLASVIQSMRGQDELIVVDNGSRDETLAEVDRAVMGFPHVQIIANGANLGYSAGGNVGLRASRGRYLALLNPDTTVPGDWIEAMEARFEDPFVAAAGPVTDCVSGRQFIGYHLSEEERTGAGLDLIRERLHTRFPRRSIVAKLLIGFCTTFRRSALDKAGLLDEDLFLGSDDLEICWRLRTHGYRLLLARDVFVHHVGSASFNTASKTETDEWLRQSSVALARKIRKAFAPGNPPTSMELWDNPIFGHMLG